MRTSAKFVGYVRMQKVINRVQCDAAEKLIIRGAEQVGNGRLIIATVPSRLLRRSNEFRRAWSADEHIPDHAGAAYSIRETTVAWKMSRKDVASVTRARSTRIAYTYHMVL